MSNNQTPSRDQITIQRLQAQQKRTERVRDLHAEIYSEANKTRGKADTYYQALDIACNVIVNLEESVRQQQQAIEDLGRRAGQGDQTIKSLNDELKVAREELALLKAPPANDTQPATPAEAATA